VRRKFTSKTSSAKDCINLNPDNVNWYGGPEQMDQRYPVQKFEFTDYAYLTKELESAAIMERYWFSSNGFFILIDYDAPLFIDQNNLMVKANNLCFTAKKALPYYTHNEEFNFNYRIGAGVSSRETHMNVINRMLGKPRGMPDERLIRYPIWNTWVRYGDLLEMLFWGNLHIDLHFRSTNQLASHRRLCRGNHSTWIQVQSS
jgi:hypothetical protein